MAVACWLSVISGLMLWYFLFHDYRTCNYCTWDLFQYNCVSFIFLGISALIFTFPVFFNILRNGFITRSSPSAGLRVKLWVILIIFVITFAMAQETLTRLGVVAKMYWTDWVQQWEYISPGLAASSLGMMFTNWYLIAIVSGYTGIFLIMMTIGISEIKKHKALGKPLEL